MTLVAVDDPGLVILPTHLVIQHLTDTQIETYTSTIHDKLEVEEFANAAGMLGQLKLRGRGYIGAAILGIRPAILHLRSQDYMARALREVHGGGTHT
jgi:hypothetical protein